MYSNFKQQAIEYVKDAVQEDNAGNYIKAFVLYTNALEYFKTHLKYEKNPEIREAISAKFTDYLPRAEEIRAILDEGGAGPGASSRDAAIATRPKSIVREEPNVSNEVAAVDGDKEASPGDSCSDSAVPRGTVPAAKAAALPLYSNLKEQAMEYIKQAIQADQAGNYAKAFPLYMNALEYFKAHLKYEKNPKIKEAISAKFTEFLRRAEEIRFVLDDANTGGVAIATKPETKGEDGDDSEQSTLRAGFKLLNSTMMVTEKPNLKNDDDVAGLERENNATPAASSSAATYRYYFAEQAMEYVKQAVQADNAGNHVEALPLYTNAVEYFKTHLMYEKNPKVKEAINAKFTGYVRRADEIRAFLQQGGAGANSGDVAVKDDKDASLADASSDPMMYSCFKEQAIQYVKQAVQVDEAGNYGKAFTLYINALENFTTYLKYEKNPKIREALNAKFSEYLRRAGEIRAFLEQSGAGYGDNGGVAAAATRPETNGKDIHGNDTNDSEQSKLGNVAGVESDK